MPLNRRWVVSGGALDGSDATTKAEPQIELGELVLGRADDQKPSVSGSRASESLMLAGICSYSANWS